jgi:site-specific DNA recombinase
MRAAIYARISQADPKVDAIADQKRRCRELASREGYDVIAEYADDGISGWSGKHRPGFLELTDGIRADRFDVVLAVAEDRFTRSAQEKIGFQVECAGHAVKWHTLSSGLNDPSTAEGRLLGTVTGGIAEYESSLRSNRVAASVMRRLAEGKDLGGARPFGYEADRITVREGEAVLVRAGCRMIQGGATVWAVAKAWDESGVQPPRASTKWRTQTVRSILMRPRNAGILEVRGQRYPTSRIQAIVSEEEHEAVVAILANPSRLPRRGPKPTRTSATGLVRCAVCGSYLQQTAARGGVRAMRCAREGRIVEGRHPSMTVEAIETQLAERALVAVLNRVRSGDEVNAGRGEVPALRLRIAEVVRQRDVQQELAAAPGANVAMAVKEIARLGEAIRTADRELDAALSADTGTAALDLARLFFVKQEGVEFVYGSMAREPWLDFWTGLSIDQRQQLLRALFHTIELLPHRPGNALRLRFNGEQVADYAEVRRQYDEAMKRATPI